MYMKRIKKHVLFALVAIALVASQCVPTSNENQVSSKYIDRTLLKRSIDYEAQVVCYTQGNSIDCMPLSDTDLSGEVYGD